MLSTGRLSLDLAEAHHVRDVLRLGVGTAVEVFDDAGAIGQGIIALCSLEQVLVQVDRVEISSTQAAGGGLDWTIASAVPKGQRADWMIEKLSELGTSAFVPLATARSVVLPEGKNKHDRWVRIATEAAKQSRRRGVMRIEILTPLSEAVRSGGTGWYLSTDPAALPIRKALQQATGARSLKLLIGPEGGWTDEEIVLLNGSGLTGVHLTATILRVETAAVAAAAVVASLLGS